MHNKIWWSYVHIRYLVLHVQKWTYLGLGWPYGWALNFNIARTHHARTHARKEIAFYHTKYYMHATIVAEI